MLKPASQVRGRKTWRRSQEEKVFGEGEVVEEREKE